VDNLKENKLARGVAFLTVSNLIVKFAGMLFKIPLTALIGEEGMGYFNTAYTLFTWFYMVSTAGLPVAAAMMISRSAACGKRAEVKKIFFVTMSIFVVLGLLGSASMILGADLFADLMKVEKSRLAIIAIAPTLFFICQSAALRGYFQGFGEMGPHAVSQVAEAIGKVALGIALAKYALSMGLDSDAAAAWAAMGLTIGIGAGMLVLYMSLIFTKNRIKNSAFPAGVELDQTTSGAGRIAKRLLKIAVPITLSSSLMSLTSLIDTLIMTRRLHDIGFSQAETISIYGNYSSLAVPLFNLPPVLIYPITYAMMPELAARIERRDEKGARELCIRAVSLTSFIALPCAAGMCALARPILGLLFAPELAERGAAMLMLLAPSSFFICILALTNTILQAYGHEKIPLYAMLVGSAVKLATSWLLIPVIGKYGTPVSTFLCYLIICVISVGAVAIKTPLGESFSSRNFVKPIVCSAASVFTALITYALLPVSRVTVLVAIAAAGVVYLLLCLDEFRGLIKMKS
jgi:stage V sporulation protein B